MLHCMIWRLRNHEWLERLGLHFPCNGPRFASSPTKWEFSVLVRTCSCSSTKSIFCLLKMISSSQGVQTSWNKRTNVSTLQCGLLFGSEPPNSPLPEHLVQAGMVAEKRKWPDQNLERMRFLTSWAKLRCSKARLLFPNKMILCCLLFSNAK